MKIKQYSAQTVALAAALLLVGSLSAKAAITLDLTDSTSKAMSGFVGNIPSTPDMNANELIGIYKFTATGGPVNPFWSTCLSPAGLLDSATHTYTPFSFSAGSPGQNPAAWSLGTEGDAGIQGAQYLWRLYSPAIIASGTKQQGAGLAMAMYEALYDSTARGVLAAGGFGSGNFSISTWAGGTGAGTAYAWANTYLGGLNSAAVIANLGTGDILRSTQPGAGQDLIWNVTPVPEPTTIIAGALLLLPFGASTIRFLRKNRTA